MPKALPMSPIYTIYGTQWDGGKIIHSLLLYEGGDEKSGDGGKEIGSVFWFDYMWDRSTVCVTGLDVDKDYRRRGYGRRLLTEMAEIISKKRMRRIILDNCCDAGNTFYEDLGFRYTSDIDNEMWIKTASLL